MAAPRRTAPRRRRASQPQRWELAVLPVRNTVVFPHLVTPLFIDRERSLRAVEQAMLGRTARSSSWPSGRPRSSGRPRVTSTRRRHGCRDRPRARDAGTARRRSWCRVSGASGCCGGAARRAAHAGAGRGGDRGCRRPRTRPKALLRAVLSLYEKCTKPSLLFRMDDYIAADEHRRGRGRLPTSSPRTSTDRCAATGPAGDARRRRAAAQASACLAKELTCSTCRATSTRPCRTKSTEPARILPARANEGDPAGAGRGRPADARRGPARAKIEASGMPEEVQAKALEELERLPPMPPGRPRSASCAPTSTGWSTLPW